MQCGNEECEQRETRKNEWKNVLLVPLLTNARLELLDHIRPIVIHC